MLRRRVLAGVAVALMASTGLVAVAQSEASAAVPAPGNCPSTHLCLYPDPDFKGGITTFPDTRLDWRKLGAAREWCGNGNWNDCVSSIYNNGTRCVALLWRDINQGGTYHTLSRGDGYRNLANINFDDQISSNTWRC